MSCSMKADHERKLKSPCKSMDMAAITCHISRSVAQQRGGFAIFAVGFLIWHVSEFSFIDFSDCPCVMLFGILEKRLVVFEGSATRFRRVRLYDQISNEFVAPSRGFQHTHVHHPAKRLVAAKTRNSQYLRLLNPIGVSKVTAKLARPQITTEIAAP